MSYPKSRLLEALRVIREDDQRRHAFEAEKLSRTQYRDKFHFRRSTASQVTLVDAWQEDQPSDEDFDLEPKKRKRQSKCDKQHREDGSPKQKRAKRSPVKQSDVSTPQDDQDLSKPSPQHDLGHKKFASADETTPSSPFLTLKLASNQGRQVLSIGNGLVREEKRELSQWELYGGGLHRTNVTVAEQEQDFREALKKRAEAAQAAGDTKTVVPVGLRSGKFRKSYLLNRRKKDPKVQDTIDDPCMERWESREKNTQPQPAPQPSQPSHRTISISSSSPPPVQSQPQIYPPATAIATATATATSTAQGTLLTLTTPFSHPIDFKSVKPTSCNFHKDYRFPLFGHGPITANYIMYPNTPGQLTETGGGHRSHNIATDTMCVPCALGYLTITRCARHKFTRMATTAARLHALRDGGQHYVKDVFRDGKKADRSLTAPVEICGVCPTPAVWRCCAVQERDRILRPCCRPGEGVDDARARLSRGSLTMNAGASHDVQPTLLGCGLVLCSACCALVGDRCGGYLQGHRDVVLREIRARKSISARADVDFLFEEGLLWKSYHVGRKDQA